MKDGKTQAEFEKKTTSVLHFPIRAYTYKKSNHIYDLTKQFCTQVEIDNQIKEIEEACDHFKAKKKIDKVFSVVTPLFPKVLLVASLFTLISSMVKWQLGVFIGFCGINVSLILLIILFYCAIKNGQYEMDYRRQIDDKIRKFNEKLLPNVHWEVSDDNTLELHVNEDHDFEYEEAPEVIEGTTVNLFSNLASGGEALLTQVFQKTGVIDKRKGSDGEIMNLNGDQKQNGEKVNESDGQENGEAEESGSGEDEDEDDDEDQEVEEEQQGNTYKNQNNML